MLLIFSWKGTFPLSPHILYHLYIFYISFIFDFHHVLFTSFTTFGVYSLLFYRPTFSSINTSSAPSVFLTRWLFPGLSLVTVCSCTCSWHLQSLWPAPFLNKSFLGGFVLCSFSLLSCGVFCLSFELRAAPEVSSADELKLFVVGGAEIFLLLLLSLVGLRSDTLSGPGAFTNTKKKLLLCFELIQRHGWMQPGLMLLFDPVELCLEAL